MDRQTFIDDLAEQLRQWDSEIEELESKVERAQPEIGAEYKTYAQKLRHKRKIAEDTLQAVKSSSDHAWKEIHSDAEQALASIKDSFWNEVSRFK